MFVETLESYYRSLAVARNEQPQHWNRASSIGMCPRRLGYTKLGIKGEPHTPRRMAIFSHGDAFDAMLKQDLIQAMGAQVITNKLQGGMEIDGTAITGEADVFFEINGRFGIADIKTASNRSFEKACQGQIDEVYQAQAWCYSKMFNVTLAVFIFYRKETSHMCEVVFDGDADGLVITQRFGGDPKEIYVQDPLLITEIRTPFDGRIESLIRENIAAVGRCESVDDLPRGTRAIEAESIKVQGAVKAEEAFKLYGQEVSKKGSWYEFKTGRQIAGFPCSYCPWIKQCLGAKLSIENSKPVWIVE